MKILMKTTLALALMISMTSMVSAQKKVQTFKVEREINVQADQLWKIVGEDYGSIAYTHPKIMSSDYINGTLKAQEGAERVCNFNEKGTQFLKEKIVGYDPANMTFVNQVYQAGKFPLVPELTRATYTVKDLGNGKSQLSFDMQFRTKPAFMGGMAKGKFKKLIADYFIGIEHYAATGEKVTVENFKEIKKKYNT